MRRLAPFLLASILLFVPAAASAQFSGSLVPCGNDVNGNGIVDASEQCQACDAVELVQNIINFLVYIASFLAVLIFSWAGLIYVTAAGNPGKLGKAHQMFTDVLLGFIVVLAGWLVIDTVMKSLFVGSNLDTSTRQTFGPWNEIKCVEPPETAIDELPEVPPGTVGTYTDNRIMQTDAETRLSAAGVSVKSGASLDGIQSHVIDEVIALNQSCNCNVFITEGTGGSHQVGEFSHANGFKLDLRTRDNPELVAYIRGLQPAGAWRDGTRLYRDRCNTYAIEGNHVDMRSLPSC